MLENEIIPLYYAKNELGFSPEWIEYIKNSIAQITPRFTMKRMIDDYISKFYTKLAKRSAYLAENGYAKAKEIVAWKEKIAANWDNIRVLSEDIPENLLRNPQVGEAYNIVIVIDIDGIKDKGVGIELVVTKLDKNNVDSLFDVQELQLVKTEESKMFFNIKYQQNKAGSFKYGFRIFPKNEDLPHRMDFCFVRWI
jgi:starch phosphorylase